MKEVKAYRCEFCGKVFLRKKYLRKNTRKTIAVKFQLIERCATNASITTSPIKTK